MYRTGYLEHNDCVVLSGILNSILKYCSSVTTQKNNMGAIFDICLVGVHFQCMGS